MQRTSAYGTVQRFPTQEDTETSPLDAIEDPEARFGSYRRLTMADEFRFSRT